jgi:hypothetical protein
VISATTFKLLNSPLGQLIDLLLSFIISIREALSLLVDLAIPLISVLVRKVEYCLKVLVGV